MIKTSVARERAFASVAICSGESALISRSRSGKSFFKLCPSM